MFAETTHTRPDINFQQMRDFLHHGWGPVGIRVAEAWRELTTAISAAGFSRCRSRWSTHHRTATGSD